MESDLNPVVLQSTSEVQNLMGDAHSKDLEHSSNTEREFPQDDFKPSSPTGLEHSSASSTAELETSANDPAKFIKSTPDDPVSTSSEKKLHVAASFSKETSDEVGEISAENQTVSSVKSSKGLPLSKEAHTIQPGLSEVTESSELIQSIFPEEDESIEIILTALSENTESTEVIQTALFEETESTQIIQPALSEETELTRVIQSALAEETESTQVIQPALSEETESTQVIQPALAEEIESIQVIDTAHVEEIESTQLIQSSLEVIQTPVSEETASTIVIQMIPSKKTESTELIQPAHSEEIELTEDKQLIVSEEVNLNKEIPFDSLESSCRTKALITSSDSKKDRIPSKNIINPSAMPEIVSKEFSNIANDLSNFEENSNSPSPPALDTESFLSLLNTEEYKNGSHFVIPGKGEVTFRPSPPREPISPNYVMPPLSPPTKNPAMESIKHLNPTRDATVTEDTCLSTLSSILADWAQRGMEKIFNNLEQPNFEDFVYCSKRELKYGLDLLEQMNELINTLLRAADGLPDPTFIFPN
ncbi:hypothetical protein AVEN_203421-1 [Araneus ventricosus]|uniref:Uncharacterized protein n=1 Tax=Araneus ventricosus TaxID=182803 RepID=A0A4Y2RAZ2_ARAVE|nr:hypothetical protein AVEN_203421-1 [Araneus ventricosus]